MTKTLIATIAIALSSIGGPGFAADMPVGAPPAPTFNWTSYLGAHIGAGWAHKDVTDPVQLAQDSIIGPGTTIGATTSRISPSGVAVGGKSVATTSLLQIG